MQSLTANITGNIKPLWTKISKPNNAKYFVTTNKGEIFELQNELKSERKDKRKEAVKKVIANMTVGKDVSALFPDVVNCMQTDNIELKKLVYLYLICYAKTQPDATLMSVNTFVRDCDHPNPLIRALAIRTMGAVRLSQISPYLVDPLRKCLNDDDPYVRKTAAVCVTKLYALDSQFATETGFLEKLNDLLSDSNPMVLANTVAAMTEIQSISPTEDVCNLLKLDSPTVMKLLTALNECTEWGQVYILDAISAYQPKNAQEAQNIIDRIIPRLAHVNPAVVLSSVKVIFKHLDMAEDPEIVVKKLRPPILSLLMASPEIQYLALRIISLLIQKRNFFTKEIRAFFVKYNDPIYVKIEKLDIMIRLTDVDNVGQVLSELKEYSNEVDVPFVRKSVRCIGRCAIKIDNSADRCVETLINLIQTKVNYVVQEAVIVIKDIFRKYPNKYERIISTLCDNLESLDEPEARASMIWIVGEYSERIDNAVEILESFVEGFSDENTQVQLQLLTAVVKLFLKRPSDSQDLVQSILGLATQESDNPDLRDRAYFYWRLLSTDPATAKDVVLAEKPLISEETDVLESNLLAKLLETIPNLSSVRHQPPSSFLERQPGDYIHHLPGQTATSHEGNRANNAMGAGSTAAHTVIPTQDILIDDLLQIGGSPTYGAAESQQYPGSHDPSDLMGLDDLLPGGGEAQFDQGASTSMSTVDALADIFGDLNPSKSEATAGTDFYEPSPTVWLDSTVGKGLEVQGTFLRQTSSGQVVMKLIVTNHSMAPMKEFAIQFDKNSFGLTPAQPLSIQAPLLPRQPRTVSLPFNTTGPVVKMNPLMKLKIAVKTDVGIFYFDCLVPLHVLFTEDGEMEKRVFLATWKDIPSDSEQQFTLSQITRNADACSRRLHNNNIFTVAKRNVDGQDMLYLSMKTTNNIWILAELKIQPNSPVFTLALKSRIIDVYQSVSVAFEQILKN